MTEPDPYRAPASFLDRSGPPAKMPSSSSGPSPVIVEHLRRTRPWTAFLSILGVIGGGIMGITALLMGIGAISGDMSNDEDTVIAIAMGVFLQIASVICLLVSILLFRYGRAIVFLVQFNRNEELEEAIGAQRVFWKVLGIATVSSIALMVLAAIAALVVAVD